LEGGSIGIEGERAWREGGEAEVGRGKGKQERRESVKREGKKKLKTKSHGFHKLSACYKCCLKIKI